MRGPKIPFDSVASDLLNGGGDDGVERSFEGDLCSSPEELVPSDCESEPKILHLKFEQVSLVYKLNI